MINFLKNLFKRKNKKPTQEQRAFEFLKKHGSITVRDLAGYPYYFNAPHGVIRNLIKSGLKLEDTWISYTQEINGVKVKNRYKRYSLVKENKQPLFTNEYREAG